ncbi:MAG: hypothetical protein V1817_04810 [Candidatus Micrarchaeota archaeon]
MLPRIGGETNAAKTNAAERDWNWLEGESNVLTANDLFVPAAAGLAALYFLLEGNLLLLLLIVLGALFAYNVWSSGSHEKRFLAPSF